MDSSINPMPARRVERSSAEAEIFATRRKLSDDYARARDKARETFQEARWTAREQATFTSLVPTHYIMMLALSDETVSLQVVLSWVLGACRRRPGLSSACWR